MVVFLIVNLPEQCVFDKELYPTLFEKAAILFMQLVLKHIFVSGNKRTATFTMIYFLNINGYDFESDFKELSHLSVYVATNGNSEITQRVSQPS
ncbi:MAG: type II toxin-antitoxin system death-on-curing family toxin [Lactobacillales bacterium]|jgi:death-on-curing protein|nr:type II toxin-antitoxin system death-on-curing family toxin [Lactobacillales bacterium]